MRRILAVLVGLSLAVPSATGGGGPVYRTTLGESVRGRPLVVTRFGDRRAPVRVLVVGCIHGTECAGTAITRRLRLAGAPVGTGIWIVDNLNPDGRALKIRQNARGVDLNRNFASGWRRGGRPWQAEFGGPRPWSEPETRVARALIRRIRPVVTIWFHQPQALVRAWGPSVPVARHYARLARMPFAALPWRPGSAPNWQNRRFRGTSSFVVELRAGALSRRGVQRHVNAILRLAGTTNAPPAERIRWRRSRALGSPGAGGLANGVRLPPEGVDFFTWDPVLKRAPNRSWRRWGTDRLVRLVLRVAREYGDAHPYAPRLGIGDLSRPNGGDFGARFGGLGHVTHQNGLDVDVYYPRLDGRERPPKYASQIHRRLAQELVDRFVRAGAVRIYVGPNTRLVGPPGVVQVLPRHDNHLHVRIRPR